MKQAVARNLLVIFRQIFHDGILPDVSALCHSSRFRAAGNRGNAMQALPSRPELQVQVRHIFCETVVPRKERRLGPDTASSLHFGHAEGGAASSHRRDAGARDDAGARQAQRRDAALCRCRCDQERLPFQLAPGLSRSLLRRHVRAADPAGLFRSRLRLSRPDGGAERASMSRCSSIPRVTPGAGSPSTPCCPG